MNTPTITLNFTDQQTLLAAYMPFIKNGGLFIATNKTYQLGDSITLALKLMDEAEPYCFSGKVIWLTSANVATQQAAGVGVQFGSDAVDLREKIENYLGEMLNNETY